HDMSQLFPALVLGVEGITQQTVRPDIDLLKTQAMQFQSGMIIVYLFAVWDQYFEHSDIEDYFRPDEAKRFRAYKHIRHVFAHNLGGDRSGNRKAQQRMDHADKLDEVMASGSPLQGVVITNEKVTLEFPDAFLGCQNFLADMAVRLGCGRISVGGAYGRVRLAGGGEHEVS
ncbi:MAG: hypothetical protein AAFY81_05895, partial [Pseudomonadota bacterium]